MKKAVAFILLSVYFVVSTGFVVSVHYCMDRINGVQLGDSSHDKCGKCGMPLKDNKGCCKDEVKVYKLQMDQSFAKFVKADFSIPFIATHRSDLLLAPLVPAIETAAPLAHGPPLSKQDTYLQNRVFRL